MPAQGVCTHTHTHRHDGNSVRRARANNLLLKACLLVLSNLQCWCISIVDNQLRSGWGNRKQLIWLWLLVVIQKSSYFQASRRHPSSQAAAIYLNTSITIKDSLTLVKRAVTGMLPCSFLPIYLSDRQFTHIHTVHLLLLPHLNNLNMMILTRPAADWWARDLSLPIYRIRGRRFR